LIAIAANGISINMMAFPLIGYQMVVTNFFQSIGKAGISIFLSLTRQMIFLVPLLIILPPIMGVDGVWYSLPISDTMAAVMAAVMIIKHIKKLKKQAI
jgi:Na+-driven multidrug efflux pump